MLLACILPFVVFLLDRSQSALCESHISIQLLQGKPFKDIYDGHPEPPTCTTYDDCGILDWNALNYIQFLQPKKTQYPLKCTMRADNVKNNRGLNPAPFFEVNKKYEANYAKFLFSQNHYIRSKASDYKLSIACSNGAYRCCLLGQKNASLKFMSSVPDEDFPEVIKPKVASRFDTGKRTSTSKNTGQDSTSPRTSARSGFATTNTTTTKPSKTKKTRMTVKTANVSKAKTNNEKTVL